MESMYTALYFASSNLYVDTKALFENTIYDGNADIRQGMTSWHHNIIMDSQIHSLKEGLECYINFGYCNLVLCMCISEEILLCTVAN